MKIFDFAVIGAGASGMVAAITCKRCNPNADVVIIEKNSELGKKILATGNGRCNIANKNHEHYLDVEKFFNEIGILTKVEAEGRVYPNSNSAKDVRDLLEFWIRALEICVIENTQVLGILQEKTGEFLLKTEYKKISKKQVRATRVLIATGGKAAPQYGSDGRGYALARSLGHSFTSIRPGLAGLECEGEFGSLKGVRVYAKARLVNAKTEEKYFEIGEVQFTEKGLSGICIFNLARYVVLDLKNRDLKEAFSDYKLEVDFLPDYSETELENLLAKRLKLFGKLGFSKILTSVVSAKLAKFILENTQIKRALSDVYGNDGDYKKDCIKQLSSILVSKLKCTEFTVIGVNGWRDAQVTAGGISACEISNTTFESYIIPGLYFAGEILDYDGICGGYNLSNAFYSGICVGREVAKCIE
ncbi:MAG: aminoacetone oxidase family FAD-binding enzyme [Eubacteriales bacterium]